MFCLPVTALVKWYPRILWTLESGVPKKLTTQCVPTVVFILSLA